MRSHTSRNPWQAKTHTWHVDATAGAAANSGNAAAPIRTLAAVNALAVKPGDRVLFRAAQTWANTALGISRSGRPGRPILYGAYGPGALPIISHATAGTTVILIEANYVAVKNLDVRGTASRAVKGQLNWVSGADGEGISHCLIDGLATRGPIELYGQYNVVQNCDIDGTLNDGVAAYPGNGILENFLASHHNRYLYNNVHNFTLRGIWPNALAHNTTIVGNTVHDLGSGANSFGIDLDGADHVTYENAIKGNLIYNINGTGIELENTFASIVDANKVYSCTLQGVYITLYSVCEVGGDAGQYGVAGDARGMDSNVLVKNNIIYSCNDGIRIADAGQVLSYFNTVTLCVESSYRTGAPGYVPNCAAKNNIFADTSPDGQITGESTLNFLAVDDHNLLQTPHHGATYVYLEFDAWAHKSLAEEQAAYPTLGVNSVQADPVFAGAGNYHLQVTSPAIGAGVAIAGITTDYDGVVRGSPPDMGALEYVA